MAVDLGFKLCRVCLTTDDPDSKLTSMFADGGEMAKMYQNISGCNILDDGDHPDALICLRCANKVELAFIFEKDIRRKHLYFQRRRRQHNQGRSEQAAVMARDEQAAVSPLNSFSRSSLEVRSDQAKLQSAQVKREPESLELGSSSSATSLKQGRLTSKSEELEAIPYPERYINEAAVEVPMVRIFQEIKFEYSGPEEAENGSSKRLRANVRKSKSHAAAAKRLKCQVCNKKFATRQNLNSHIDAIHEKTKNFGCEQCPYKSSYKGNLVLHQQRHHSNDRRFSCPSCLKSFKTIQDLNQHKKSERCQAAKA